MTDSIILTNEQFFKIFSNAYAVVINGCIYAINSDYDTEDGTLCTAFTDPNDFNYTFYIVPREIEEGRVSYNPRYKEFYFEDARGDIPPFQILGAVSID